MTPERMAGLAARWVRFYTRDLPTPIAERRIDEIDADVFDHIAHERAAGTGDPKIAMSIASRMVRGLAADAAWASTRKEVMKNRKPAHRSAVRVALITAAILLVPLIGMQVSDGVDWSLADFVMAAILLGGTGLLLELAASKPRSVTYKVAAVAVALAAMVLGEADDAPGLVLFGCLVIAGTIALTVRAAFRSS